MGVRRRRIALQKCSFLVMMVILVIATVLLLLDEQQHHAAIGFTVKLPIVVKTSIKPVVPGRHYSPHFVSRTSARAAVAVVHNVATTAFTNDDAAATLSSTNIESSRPAIGLYVHAGG
jgi:hypothetical protein